jgi:hypothetical protein
MARLTEIHRQHQPIQSQSGDGKAKDPVVTTPVQSNI